MSIRELWYGLSSILALDGFLATFLSKCLAKLVLAIFNKLMKKAIRKAQDMKTNKVNSSSSNPIKKNEVAGVESLNGKVPMRNGDKILGFVAVLASAHSRA